MYHDSWVTGNMHRIRMAWKKDKTKVKNYTPESLLDA